MSVVFARKYRPKQLSQIVGQSTVVQTLTNAIKKANLHHAYLFVGQFGSGKTTVARILAAMENCEVSPGLHPCGTCPACEQIFEGKHTDVKEIDAASEAGSVDQIRELKKEALYNPVDGAKTKYFIIDESHRMSQQANDALLKLLEEPPNRTRFILCTTDVAKMRPAIVSRCQKHDYTKIFWMQIADYLATVAKDENIQIDQGAINLCAKRARGSMRNALQYMDKLFTFAGGSSVISVDNAEKMFGNVSEVKFYDLFDSLFDDKGPVDTTKGFRIINEMFMGGADYTAIVDGIVEYLDMLMVGMTCSKASEFVHLTEDGKARLIVQLKKCREQNKLVAVLRSMEKLSESSQWMFYNPNPETALRKWFLESVVAFRSPT